MHTLHLTLLRLHVSHAYEKFGGPPRRMSIKVQRQQRDLGTAYIVMVSQSAEVIKSRAKDVYSIVLGCERALCFGQNRLVAPKLEAGIKVALMIDTRVPRQDTTIGIRNEEHLVSLIYCT